MSAAERIAQLIHREGSITFDAFVELALYDDADGFFERGGGAGRASADFVTSPETGALFGALVARAIDRAWRAHGEPDPFLVVEAGAGRGQLAREVQRAEPECLPALRYVMVERSARLRREQHDRIEIEPADEALGPFLVRGSDELVPAPRAGPVFAALDDLPALEFDGVIVANELLDNLPFGIAEWDGTRWLEIRVAFDARSERDDARLTEIAVEAATADAVALAACTDGFVVPAGTRLPIPRGMHAWLDHASRVLRHGTIVLIDYIDDVGSVLAREPSSWLRTYRAHARGAAPLEQVGTQDITSDIVAEQLRQATRAARLDVAHETTQAEWLTELGIADLVTAARATWDARTGPGDLTALAARSRVSEAAALTDPAGLGAHRVVTLQPR